MRDQNEADDAAGTFHAEVRSRSMAETMADTHRTGVELVITDAKTAMTLLDLAETTSEPEARSRRIGEALKAYQTNLRFLARLSPTAEQFAIVTRDMEALKARLRAVGARIE